jgi:hypothetical protein
MRVKNFRRRCKECPEIIKLALSVHNLNPAEFFVYDFDNFCRSKSVDCNLVEKRMITGQFWDKQVSPAQMLVFIVI